MNAMLETINKAIFYSNSAVIDATETKSSIAPVARTIIIFECNTTNCDFSYISYRGVIRTGTHP